MVDMNWPAIATHALEDKQKMPLPPLLYRYRNTGKFTEAIITKREVFFASPASFNDPFDCGFHIPCHGEFIKYIIRKVALKSVLNLHPKVSDKEANEAAEVVTKKILSDHHDEASNQFKMMLCREFNDKAGVLCLAATNSDILMWSHYADCHKGICLEFRTDIKDSIFNKAEPFIYSDQYPHLDLDELAEFEQLQNWATWMLTKSSHWSYEKEWRILDFDSGPGLKSFDSSCLSTVILGCCISDEDRRKVLGWVRDYPRPLCLMQARKSSTNFSIEFTKIDAKL